MAFDKAFDPPITDPSRMLPKIEEVECDGCGKIIPTSEVETHECGDGVQEFQRAIKTARAQNRKPGRASEAGASHPRSRSGRTGS